MRGQKASRFNPDTAVCVPVYFVINNTSTATVCKQLCVQSCYCCVVCLALGISILHLLRKSTGSRVYSSTDNQNGNKKQSLRQPRLSETNIILRSFFTKKTRQEGTLPNRRREPMHSSSTHLQKNFVQDPFLIADWSTHHQKFSFFSSTAVCLFLEHNDHQRGGAAFSPCRPLSSLRWLGLGWVGRGAQRVGQRSWSKSLKGYKHGKVLHDRE